MQNGQGCLVLLAFGLQPSGSNISFSDFVKPWLNDPRLLCFQVLQFNVPKDGVLVGFLCMGGWTVWGRGVGG